MWRMKPRTTVPECLVFECGRPTPDMVALHIAGIHNDWLADLTTDAPPRDITKGDPT